MNSINVAEEYKKAYKLGKTWGEKLAAAGKDPCIPALDELIDIKETAGMRKLGQMDIPSDLIVGTKTSGRQISFAANFMPLMDPESEFASKWKSLCGAHLSEAGIQSPVECCEYMGKFYVIEGNKRVSVFKYFDAPVIPGTVTRIIPAWNEDTETRIYYEFMVFYKLSGIYLLGFSETGSYKKLQKLMGYEPEHSWTELERRVFSGTLFRVSTVLKKVLGTVNNMGDVFLDLLRLYSFKTIHDMSDKELTAAITKLVPDIMLMGHSNPINLDTEAEEETEGIFSRLFGPSQPSSLNVAFIYSYPPEKSDWINAHEHGRQYIEQEYEGRVRTRVYSTGAEEDAAFEQAVADGANVIFAPTSNLVTPARRAALKYPRVRVLSCAVYLPFPEVRTYYSRIYEGKFISGALAGAMTKTGRVGYVAGNPIYGVPAGINAFALGARLTNPDVKVFLRWTSVSTDTFAELKSLGVDMISNRDIPTPVQEQKVWGLCKVEEDGSMHPVCSPFWNWGKMYSHILDNIFSGSWDRLSYKNSGKAVNYWWGISTGSVDVVLDETVPQSMKELADMLRLGIAGDYIHPFERRLVTQSGELINDGSRNLSPEEILKMNWLCDFIEGSIPKYDELLPIAKNQVDALGIY